MIPSIATFIAKIIFIGNLTHPRGVLKDIKNKGLLIQKINPQKAFLQIFEFEYLLEITKRNKK